MTWKEFLNNYSKEASAFSACYEIFAYATGEDDSTNNRPLNSERKCRFCNKNSKQTPFKKIAHIIPQMLGNRQLISYSECDSCNEKMGVYENHLANFIGVSRAINKTKNKKGKIPSIDSPDRKTTVRPQKFESYKAIKAGSGHLDSGAITWDPKNKQFSFQQTKHPYRPIFVYCSLLKMALHLLPSDIMPKYHLGVLLLHSKKMQASLLPGSCPVTISTLPIASSQIPTLLLFKHKKEVIDVPPLTLVLLYGHFIYQIFIPFETDFVTRNFGKPLQVPVFPQYFYRSQSLDLTILSRKTQDLTGSENITDDVETIVIKPANFQPEKLVAIYPVTKKLKNTKYDPNTVASFLIFSTPPSIQINNEP